MRRDKAGGIHRIQQPALEQVDLGRDYDVLRVLGEGCFAQVLLARHRSSATTVVLKAVHVELARLSDFHREFHYSYHLSPHPAILSSYSVAFRTERSFVFAQEYAPLGDLAGNVRAGGLGEAPSKHVARQLSSALDFVHSQGLVHGDLKLENVLVFAADMSRVKLCDFGSTRRAGSLVPRTATGCAWQPFLPPEVCETVCGERYPCRTAADCWQLGIALHVCLTGCPPWRCADAVRDPRYATFLRWQGRRTAHVPRPFLGYGPRLLRLLRRLLEPREEKRAPVVEVAKYLGDVWLPGRPPPASDPPGQHRQSHHDQRVQATRVWEWLLSCDDKAESSVEGV
ncbi:hypothetical protein PR048_000149 [Dryococelus australis]|uniref:Protein kinase domain-containing protein n=1 Tax=Dryococelus australis TaxID=614101 RepID=A0ABQ9IDV4_9NEOP|nr:hypothetical protein PR048_000149 [Dryococelus australis]